MSQLSKLAAVVLVAAATASFALAGDLQSPEIDPTSAAGAFTLLTGAALILRARRKK